MFGGSMMNDMNSMMKDMNNMMNMNKMGISDRNREKKERFKEIEAKIQRGEAREEDYPDYMEAKRSFYSRNYNEEKKFSSNTPPPSNIPPSSNTPVSTTTVTEIRSHIPTIRKKWKESGPEASFQYIESVIYKMTFNSYYDVSCFFE